MPRKRSTQESPQSQNVLAGPDSHGQVSQCSFIPQILFSSAVLKDSKIQAAQLERGTEREKRECDSPRPPPQADTPPETKRVVGTSCEVCRFIC